MRNTPAVYGYHAHVYYDAATLPVADKLKEELGSRFDVELGPNSGERVGPHPVPQFQMIFKNEQFQTVVPWLMLNREGLDILIHPLIDDMVDDHTVYALWLVRRSSWCSIRCGAGDIPWRYCQKRPDETAATDPFRAGAHEGVMADAS